MRLYKLVLLRPGMVCLFDGVRLWVTLFSANRGTNFLGLFSLGSYCHHTQVSTAVTELGGMVQTVRGGSRPKLEVNLWRSDQNRIMRDAGHGLPVTAICYSLIRAKDAVPAKRDMYLKRKGERKQILSNAAEPTCSVSRILEPSKT